jgi:hypothetical protein
VRRGEHNRVLAISPPRRIHHDLLHGNRRNARLMTGRQAYQLIGDPGKAGHDLHSGVIGRARIPIVSPTIQTRAGEHAMAVMAAELSERNRLSAHRQLRQPDVNVRAANGELATIDPPQPGRHAAPKFH